MTTTSIHGANVDVERRQQIQHFDEVDLGAVCVTDKKNEAGEEHGTMCKLGLRCVDADGEGPETEKRCEKQFDMVGDNAECDTDEFKFIIDGSESGRMCNTGLLCKDHEGHKMCMEPKFTEVGLDAECDTDRKNEGDLTDGNRCKLGLKCEGAGPGTIKQCKQQFEMVGDGSTCDTDAIKFITDGSESGKMCDEGLECMAHGGHKMCMEPHADSANLANYSLLGLIMMALMSLLF